MKTLFLCALLFAAAAPYAQSSYYNRVFEAKYMSKPPVFTFGPDSLKRFYYSHFPAFDTVLSLALANGDTAKFIRIYFSFYLDENGFAYDPQFERVAATKSAVTENARTIRYFNEMKGVLQSAVKTMLHQMPQWRPGLQDGQPVKTLNYDYLQFWVGLSTPQ